MCSSILPPQVQDALSGAPPALAALGLAFRGFVVAQSAAATTAAARLTDYLAQTYRMYADPHLLQQQHQGQLGYGAVPDAPGAAGDAKAGTAVGSRGSSRSRGKDALDPYTMLELCATAGGCQGKLSMLADGTGACTGAEGTSSSIGIYGGGAVAGGGSCNLVPVSAGVLCFGSRGLLAPGRTGTEEVETAMRSGCLLLLVCPPALTLEMLVGDEVAAVAAIAAVAGRGGRSSAPGGVGAAVGSRSSIDGVLQHPAEVSCPAEPGVACGALAGSCRGWLACRQSP
jgi:hypothetical protein